MTIHLIRLAVGVESVEHLAALQATRYAQSSKRKNGRKLRAFTRNTPRRAGELIEGGSLYWVIKGLVRLRQLVLAVEPAVNPEGRPCCGLVLDGALVPTIPVAKRPFQGWRYLTPERAPADLGTAGHGAAAGMPPEMAAELRELGLL